MKERIIAVIVLVALAAGIGVLVVQKQRSPRVSREKMVEEFIAILPDSLDNDHILEVRQLFYMLWERDKQGKVKPETTAEITHKLAAWVEKGRIAPNELVHFMAEVGYNTYKDEQRYNLPDSVNDNPILNPEGNKVSLKHNAFDSTGLDSTFWKDFEKWKRDNPDIVDSLTQEPFVPPGRRD